MDHIDSYYAQSRNLSLEFPHLNEQKNCDVCIIGGGLTGIGTALFLKQSGYNVTVIEGNRIGWGASGRNGGQFLVGYSTSLDKIIKYVGKENAQQVFDFTVESLDLVKQLVKKHQIDCDLVEGSLTAAVKKRHSTDLREMIDEYEHYGFHGCQFIPQNEISNYLGTDQYLALLHDPHSGHLHPLNLLLGLTKAAHESGVTIYENTLAHSYKKEHGKITVQTEQGEITADALVMAGNAYLNNFEKKIEKKIMPAGTYIIATEPLSKAFAETLIKNNDAVCDLNFVLDYYRLSADRRLLYGGQVSYSGIDPLSISRSIQKRMHHIFPQTKNLKVDFSWGGSVAITQNRAPHFGRLNQNVYFAQGYSGHGVAMSLMAGKMLAEAIAGDTKKLDMFQKIKHTTFLGGKLLRKPMLSLAMSYFRLRDYL